MPVLGIERDWEEWSTGRLCEQLEREILPNYLRPRRWFAGKSKRLEALGIVDQARLPGSSHPTLFLIEARYADGSAEMYSLAIAVSPEPGPTETSVIAEIDGPGGRRFLIDALNDSDGCTVLLHLVGSAGSIATKAGGQVQGIRTAAFEEARGPVETPRPIRLSSAEQSNSAVLFGDRLILKVFRRPEPGLNPDFEIGRFLTETARFDRVPRTAGAIEYRRPGAEPTTLAILQALVANEGSGWEYMLDALVAFFQRLERQTPFPPPASRGTSLDLATSEPPDEVGSLIGSSLRDARILGQRTAELHQALASDDEDPAFAPRPLSPEDFLRVAIEVREQVETTLDVLADRLMTLRPPADHQARRVLGAREDLLGSLQELTQLNPGGQAIRVHGDYHLGQVLRVRDDFFILDFEGEPARPLARRRQMETPIKDVVGMLRSFDYAAFAGLLTATEGRSDAAQRLAPWARAWSDWTAAAFLDAYLRHSVGAAYLPADRKVLAALVGAFTIDKALYELLYELNNRPDWVRIPLGGVLTQIERGGAMGNGSA